MSGPSNHNHLELICLTAGTMNHQSLLISSSKDIKPRRLLQSLTLFNTMLTVVDTVILSSQTKEYCNVAGFAIVIYDWVICFPQEVELIWPTRWSLGKMLYIATRYSAFLDSIFLLYLASPNLSTPTCDRIFTVSSWLVIIGMVISETVLVFRTWAVWERNLKLSVILLGVLCPGAIVSFVLLHSGLLHVEFGTTAEGYPPGCWLITFSNDIIIIDYIIILSFEIAFLILTLYKCRDAIKGQKSKLLFTLHRDAILYCFFIAVCSLANIINQVIPSESGPSFEELQRVIHSVLTARILLNLRQAINASRLKTYQHLTLNWEAVDPRGSSDHPGMTGIRNRQQGSPASVIRSYLSTIFIVSLDMDSETWAHDEESAKRSEITECEEHIELTVLSTGSHDQEAQ